MSAPWLFPPCLHPGFSSKTTDPHSYIDVLCLGHLLTHLHIRGQCSILETMLVFRDAASSGDGIYEASAGTQVSALVVGSLPQGGHQHIQREKNSQKPVVYLIVSNN